MFSIKHLNKSFGIIAVITTAMTLSACRGEVQQKKSKNVREGALSVLGDKSKCIFAGPPGGGTTTPLEGTWDSLDWQETEKLRFTFALIFSPIPNSTTYNLQYSNFCTHKETNRSAIAAVSSTISDQIKYFEVAKSGYAEKTEKFPDFEITCDAESVAGPYEYKFDGVCLVIDGGYFVKRK